MENNLPVLHKMKELSKIDQTELDSLDENNDNNTKTKSKSINNDLISLVPDANSKDVCKDDCKTPDEWVSTMKFKLDYRIGHLSDAPNHVQDNEFILHGYRINFNSCKQVTKSLCMCHNETVNVWTHLIGAILTFLFIVITSFNVGPQGSYLNNLQLNQRIRYTDQFNNYSNPFYSSLPVFHNARLVFKTLLDYSINLNNTSLSDGTVDGKKSISNKLILNNISKKLEKFYLFIHYLSNKIEKNSSDVDCFSCLQDLIRNIFSILSSINNIESFSIDLNFVKNYPVFPTKSISLLNSRLKTLIEIIDFKINHKRKDKFNLLEVGFYIVDELKNNSYLVKWPIYIQLACAIICLSCSSTFHLYAAHSPAAGEILSRLDYGGISILIAGSCYPPYFYMYYCNSFFLLFYLLCITIFALAVFLGSLSPSFNKARNRRLRGLLFLFLGISAGVPIIHLITFFDKSLGMIEDAHIILYVLGGVTYISGCLIYISRTPERWYPGRFDLIGSSHQIWHVFVFTGIMFHHYASIYSYYDRLNYECPV